MIEIRFYDDRPPIVVRLKKTSLSQGVRGNLKGKKFMGIGMPGVYLILGAIAFGWVRFFIAFNRQRPRP